MVSRLKTDLQPAEQGTIMEFVTSTMFRSNGVELVTAKRTTKVRFIDFNDLTLDSRKWGTAIIEAIGVIRSEKESDEKSDGEQVMDSLTFSDFQKYVKADRNTSYTQLCLDESNKRLIGFVVAWPKDSADNKAPNGTNVVTIEKFGVIKKYRNIGIGKALLYNLAIKALSPKALAKKPSPEKKQSEQKSNAPKVFPIAPVDQMRVLVYKANEAAIAVYRRLGFEFESTEKDKSKNSWLMSAMPQMVIKAITSPS